MLKRLVPLLALAACAHRAAPPPPAALAPRHWTRAFDLDGDSVPDAIEPSFSGGGHCCYEIAVRLSSTRTTTRLPFQLDGGYVGGLDLSQPDRFDVRAGQGGAELFMEIGTYGSERPPLPASWRRLGALSHRIAVSFRGARLRVRNLPDALPPVNL